MIIPTHETDASAATASEPDGPPASSGDARLGSAAAKGSTVTLLGHGTSAVIRIASNLIITRLLLPEHFGLMALVTVFLVGLALFSDLGIGPNIIQNPRGEDPDFFNTAFTVGVLRGLVLWAAACLLAWPLARFYQQPQLLSLLPVAGLAALFGGMESTRVSVLNRRLRFAAITMLEVSSQVLGVIIMIGMALVWRSVWVLVLSTVLGTLARTILSHTVLPGPRNHFKLEPAARRSIIEFGRWIFLSTALTFLATQGDRLILGKLVTVEELGFYSIAANLAGMPLQILQRLGQRVFFPVVAAAMRREDHDPATIRKSRARMLLTLAPVIALGVAMAPAAVRILYRPNFHAVGLLAACLSIGTWLGLLSTSYGVVLLAGGAPKFMSLGQGIKVGLMATLVWFVAPRYGAVGVAVLISLCEIGLILANMLGCRRFHVVSLLTDFGTTLLGAALVGLFLLLHTGMMRLTGSAIASLVVVSLLGMGMSLGVARKVHLI